jgi:ubiquinone/menaquinone biosynthesis C-methylase UbiE
MQPKASPLETVADLLACPRCRGELAIGTREIHCAGCGARYGLDDGVPLLAVRGGSETWGAPQPTEQGSAYQDELQDLERAAAYNLQFRRQLLKLGTTPRERALIRRHIRRVGHSHVILDLPSGGGRLTPAFADSADLVIEADVAIGQIRYGRAHSKGITPRVWMTASAFHIPLRDASVDGAVCVRLVHHFPTVPERERLFAELLRVARRFVILTFFDRRSFKNVTRRWRHPFARKPPKPTMTLEEVVELSRANGARLVDAPRLSWIGSGHRYALLLKVGAG